jgi:hypothetical protein
MAASLLAGVPGVIHRDEVVVMEGATLDDPDHIRALWAWFEITVGLRGRKMYARVDPVQGTYTSCTPVRGDDDPEALGLVTGALPGGPYLRGRLVGEPPGLYDRIPDAMAELEAVCPRDPDRPLIEFYRRHDHIELWVPVLP